MNILSRIRSSNGFLTKKGKLTNKKEIHAFGIGIYHGITPTKGIPETVLDENDDVRHEPHYAKGGYVIGRVGMTAAGVVAGGTLL